MTHNRKSFPSHCSGATAPSPPLHSLLSAPCPDSPPRAISKPFSLPFVPLGTRLMMITHNHVSFPTRAEHEATIAAAAAAALPLHSSLSALRPGSSPRALLTPFSSPAVPLDTCLIMMTHNRINFPNHCSGAAATLSTRPPLPPPPPLHSSLSAPHPGSPPRVLPTLFSSPTVPLDF